MTKKRRHQDYQEAYKRGECMRYPFICCLLPKNCREYQEVEDFRKTSGPAQDTAIWLDRALFQSCDSFKKEVRLTILAFCIAMTE